MKTSTMLLQRLFFLVLFCTTLIIDVDGVTITSTAAGGAWSNPSTWVGNALPGTSNDVLIVGNVAINSGESFWVMGITIDQNATLTINAGGYLRSGSRMFLGTATLSGHVILNSEMNNPCGLFATSGILIRPTGTLTVRQTLSQTAGSRKFHIIGIPFLSSPAPVTVSNFLNVNGNKLETNNTNTVYALARYEETMNGWTYLDQGASAWTTPTAQSNMDPCFGFAIALKAGVGNETIVASGKPIASTPFTYALKRSTTGTPPKGGFGWNALANPFLTSLNVNTLLTRNADILDSNFGGLYLWDPETQSYVVYTLASSAPYLSICQGFIVRTKANGSNFYFEYNQIFNASGATLKSAQIIEHPEITLKAGTQALQRITKFSFVDQMTTGLDPYYDAGYLSSGNGMELYSKMISGSSENYALQALPSSGFDELVIPVQLDLTKGAEVAFSADVQGFPNGSKVMLEDRTTGILTDLKQDPPYKVNLPGNLTALQRFYLHISMNGTAFPVLPKTQTDHTITGNGTDIYVTGTFAPQSKALVYDLTGTRLGSYDLNEMGTTLINTNLKTGVYLVKIAQPNRKTTSGKVYLKN
ncbi:MAG: T9SS type A sorting domain-containing protein [Marinilabiliales bacterium]|nr:T9SS type A sorting domain-containing protein [Marinilabiliales bacterium]